MTLDECGLLDCGLLDENPQSASIVVYTLQPWLSNFKSALVFNKDKKILLQAQKTDTFLLPVQIFMIY